MSDICECCEHLKEEDTYQYHPDEEIALSFGIFGTGKAGVWIEPGSKDYPIPHIDFTIITNDWDDNVLRRVPISYCPFCGRKLV